MVLTIKERIAEVHRGRCLVHHREVARRSAMVDGRVAELVYFKCRYGEGAWRPQGRRPVRHGPLCPAGGGSGAKATDRSTNKAKGRIKRLLLDTAKLATVVALSTVKYHDPSFNLQKVSEDMDLSDLVRCEDVVAVAKVVVKKFDFDTD
jgi:hypothetical protein